MRTASAYSDFLDALAQTVETRPDALGLVLLGSTAARERADEWSDHDFFIVTADAAQEVWRTELSWLPDAARIALSVRETEHGLKVVYDDGHVLEFAVFSFDELLLAEANAWTAPVDKGAISDRMTSIAARPKRRGHPETALGLFVAHLLIGVGRARRGEVLSGGQSVRSHALAQLLSALATDGSEVDSLDPFRRFEKSHPGVGARIGTALERDVESAARELLDIAREQLGSTAAWPTRAVTALCARLDWD